MSEEDPVGDPPPFLFISIIQRNAALLGFKKKHCEGMLIKLSFTNRLDLMEKYLQKKRGRRVQAK
jgi:hypothetical protein